MFSYRYRAIVFVFLSAIFFPADIVLGQSSASVEPGSIVRVRVYTDRAEITRHVERTFPSGSGVFTVKGLPASLIPDSVRVSLIDGLPGELSILNAERSFDTGFSSPAIQKQEELILALNERLNAQGDTQSILGRQLRALDSITSGNAKPRGKGEISTSFNADWADQAIDYISKKGMEITGKLRQSKRQSDVIEQKLVAAKKKLADLQKGAKKQTWSLSGQGQFNGQGHRIFELKYQTRQARWNPAYVARADSIGKKMTLEYYGEISQSSGEDWNGVELELSTGNPQFGGVPPKLFPWIVDYYNDRPRVMMDSMAESSMEKRGRGVAKAFSQAVPIQKAQGGHALLYVLNGKHNIETGSAKMRAEISRKKFEAHLNYLTIPKKSDRVYLTTDWINSGGYEYLPGRVWKYLDGDFVGTSHLKSAVPEGKMEIALGVDPNIRVEKKLIKKEGGDGGLFNSKNRQRYVYEIELENLNSKAKSIEVQDQIPLSYQEDIVVKVNRLEPKPDKKDNENVLRWKVDLSPREKKRIVMDFQVEYPEGKKVSGL